MRLPNTAKGSPSLVILKSQGVAVISALSSAMRGRAHPVPVKKEAN
jgi:hypothetical protein